ncbi:MAG: tetratricopeptide repeat protein, partial [Rhizobacter sp.]|nr:tetratricopeptide repeat protein [Chlorobiales bacterium]
LSALDGALPDLESAIMLSDEQQSLFTEKAYAFQILAKHKCGNTDYEGAMRFATESLQIFETLADRRGTLGSLTITGDIQVGRFDYAAALETYRNALAICDELGDRSRKAEMLAGIGSLYAALSDYATALEFHHKSLFIRKETSDKNGIAVALGNIGNTHFALSDYDSALEFHRQSLAISEELDDKTGIALSQNNLGDVYTAISDYDGALKCHHKSLFLCELTGDETGMAMSLQGIGEAYFMHGNYAEALEHEQKSLEIAEATGNKRVQVYALTGIGQAFSKLGDEPQAESFFLKAATLAAELGMKKETYEAYQELAAVYERAANFEKAYHAHKQFHRIKENVFGEEQMRKREGLEILRQTEKLQLENGLSERMLLSVLPKQIVERLKAGEGVIADAYSDVSILFADIVGFTVLASGTSPEALVIFLNDVFSRFDVLTKKFGLEKIKTIGDAYMVAGGLLERSETHLERLAEMALEMQREMDDYDGGAVQLKVRIGMHCGAAVAGVIGTEKLLYDLWGDAVNTAARMESHGVAGEIH